MKKEKTTMKSMETIRRHKKRLRHLIDTSKDPYETRIAYAMEQTLEWVTDSKGWGWLDNEAKLNAMLLRSEKK